MMMAYNKMFGFAKSLLLDIQKGQAKTEVPSFFIPINNIIRYRTTDMFWAVEIQTTTECNRKCVYCPNSKYKPKKRLMPIGTYRKIIKDLSKLRFAGRISPHLYGEPLLDKRLPDLVRLTKEELPSTYICILTNGDFLTPRMSRTLVQHGVDDFLITLHDQKVPHHIRTLLSNLDNKSSKRIHLLPRDQLVLTNRGGLIELENLVKVESCVYPKRTLTINCVGDVVLCCNDYLGNYVMGNVNQESIKDIWHNPNFVTLRRNIKSGRLDLEICKLCGIQSR